MHVNIPRHLVSNLFSKRFTINALWNITWIWEKSKRPLDCQSWWQCHVDCGNLPGGLNSVQWIFDRIAITWEGSLSQNSRRGLCEGWSLAARIPEVTERKQWYLSRNGWMDKGHEICSSCSKWWYRTCKHWLRFSQPYTSCSPTCTDLPRQRVNKSKKKSVPRPTSRDQFESILIGVSTSAQPAYPGKSSLRNDK